MKKIIGFALAIAFSAAAVFADGIGLYGKLNAGFADGSVHASDSGVSGSVGFSGFDFLPALGICPDATSFPDKPFDITFEAQLGMIFANGDKWDNVKVTVINPGVMAFFNWHFENTDSEFLKHFVPYGGAGFSVPIQMVKWSYSYWYWNNEGKWVKHSADYSSTEIGIDINFVAGARYEFTEKFAVNAETGYNTLEMNNWFLRGGVLYRFK